MSGPLVSDHALIRFLERGGEMDVERLRSDLQRALERAHRTAEALGQDDYLVKAGGSTFVVRGGNVTTVLESGNPGKQARAIGPGHK